MRFAKETILGYQAVNVGELSEDWTHAVVSREEYWANRTEREALRRDLARATREKETYQKEYSQAEQENRKLRAAQRELEANAAAAEELVRYQKRLNENLLRINRERANAARELTPKKQHTGYTVLLSDEKKSSTQRESFWDTRIQTPYSIDFDEGTVRMRIEEELLASKGLVTRLGVKGIMKSEELMQLSLEEKGALLSQNRVTDHFLRVNYRAGYWEIVVRHTKPLGIVPEELRP